MRILVENKINLTIVDLKKAIEINILRDKMLVIFENNVVVLDFDKPLNDQQMKNFAREILSRINKDDWISLNSLINTATGGENGD